MAAIRMRTRSQVPQAEKEAMNTKPKKVHLEDLPVLKYDGNKVTYTTDFIETAMCCDKLLTQVKESTDLLFLGFDLEWTFSFQTGPEKVALIQICPSLDVCHLFHVSKMQKLPASLTELLAHDRVRITGVNIKNDIRKLGRDYNLNVDKMIENCIDCGVFANQVLPLTQRWSMEKLVAYVMEKQINKDKKVRNSKWHIQPLSEEQTIYAAIDAFASLELYLLLKKKESELEVENKDSNTL